MHVITDHRGMPLRICSTAANGDERKQALCMLNTLPRSKTTRFFQADKGYDCRWLRQKLIQKGYYPIIAHRTFVRKKSLPKALKKLSSRWKIERTFAWIKRKYKRLLCRWERKRCCWEGFVLCSMDYVMAWTLIGIGSWFVEKINHNRISNKN